MAARNQTLDSPTVPNLPLPATNYSQYTQDQHNGLVRTFMLKIANVLQALFGPFGGQYLDCPHGLFFNTADQTFAAANTAYPVVFNQTYLSHGISKTDSSRITIEVGGIYNIQYSGQMISTSGSAKTMYLWIRRNGTDIGYSTRASTVDTNNHLTEITWSFDIDLDANEYVEMMVSASTTEVNLEAVAPTSPHVGIPSSVLTVNFIGPLPTTRPTPP